MTKAERENPLLAEAFDKLASPDPQARRAGVAFLKTNVGWHLLMRSEDKDKVQKLLRLLVQFLRAICWWISSA